VRPPNPFGACKWHETYSNSLSGATAVILPDNDEAGRRHTDAVTRSLRGIAASVKVVALPNLPEKGDVSDWLAEGHTRDELEQLAADAPEWMPDATLRSGGQRRVPSYTFLPLAALRELPPPTWLVEDILPSDSLSVFYGRPGSFKSFAVLDLALCVASNKDWHGHTVERGPVALVATEGRATALNQRIEAWRSYHEVTDDPDLWVMSKPVELLDSVSMEALAASIKTASLSSDTHCNRHTLAVSCGRGREQHRRDDTGNACASATSRGHWRQLACRAPHQKE
jgi:hypothetical protein